MKYGIREICDVVLKARATMNVGNKTFYKDEPVIYFDTLKTSTLEGASTTVYAQGGKGNARLMAWEGERTVTFTMEDALISPAGLAILTGAGVINATEGTPVYQHIVETCVVGKDIPDGANDSIIKLSHKAYTTKGTGQPTDASHPDYIYVMKLDADGNVISEPYIYTIAGSETEGDTITPSTTYPSSDTYVPKKGEVVLVDYYTKRTSGAQQIEITPDSFGGNFYLEASTLFRDTNGQDVPAEFIIPNCKIQSNFTFSMASSGDPSTFTFTMDAFPAATRFNPEKKVLSVIQIIPGDKTATGGDYRSKTDANGDAPDGVVEETTED